MLALFGKGGTGGGLESSRGVTTPFNSSLEGTGKAGGSNGGVSDTGPKVVQRPGGGRGGTEFVRILEINSQNRKKK